MQPTSELLKFQKKLMNDFITVPKNGKIVSYFDLNFIVYPTVFWPRYDSMPLVSNYKINSKDTVLDLCTGAGNIAIISALKGASKVIGIDINPNAIKSAKENAKIHHVSDITEFRLSDMFDKVPEKFDVITANLPFTNKKPNKIVERTMWDEDMYAYKRLFNGLDSHLKKNGRVYLSQMNLGVWKKVIEMARKKGFSTKKIGTLKHPFYNLEYLAFELRKK